LEVCAHQYDPESDFRIDWDTNAKDSVIITQYLGSKKEVRIPPSIQNFSVTEIGDEVFADNNNITGVTIPDGVTRIGIFTFEGCSSLTSITIGNSVESIGYWAFANCTSLTSVIKGNNVKSIGNRAFNGCDSLTSVTFQGLIPVGNFDEAAFDGDLRDKYLECGIGTYTRAIRE
jgi:hypothetical protein